MPAKSPTDHHNPDILSHHNEIRALRLALARLESQLGQTDDPAALVRLSAAIARVSDSIVRATAAHHRLAALAEKARLATEWEKLEAARQERLEEEEQREQNRAVWTHDAQADWLLRLAGTAHEAAQGDPLSVKEFAARLDAYVAAGDHTYPPDRFILARLGYATGAPLDAGANHPPGESIPYPANLGARDPVVQLR
jgi:hypothetical protein